jgi:hypothetical protein
MTETEFEALYWQAAPLLEEERLERLNARPRQRAMGAGGQYRNDIRNRLLMGLIWLRIYPIYEVLGFLFDLHKSNVSRNLEVVLEVLHQLLGDEVAWPDEEQRKKKGMDQFLEEFADVVAIVDATEQPIQRPQDDETQRRFYSGKKKRHTVKHQIVVTPEGEIIHTGEAASGSTHDKTMFDDSGVGDRLQGDEAYMGDKGYQGIQRDCKAVLPHKRPQGGELTEEQKAHNSRLSSVRVVVEHTIGWMKHFRVLAQTYRHPRESHNRAFEIVAGLVNRRIRRRRCSVAFA